MTCVVHFNANTNLYLPAVTALIVFVEHHMDRFQNCMFICMCVCLCVRVSLFVMLGNKCTTVTS